MYKKLLSVLMTMLLCIILVSCSNQESFKENSIENSAGDSRDIRTENSIIFPASINTIDGQKWGYINDRAEFKIKPEYDGAEEFNKAGIALVFNYFSKEKNYYRDKNIFIIDKAGKRLSGPIKCTKYFIADHNIVIIENGRSRFINGKGEVIKETESEVLDYNEGMLRFLEKVSDKSRYGFMDENGTVVIPANYNYAEQFKGMKAKVTLKEGEKTDSFFVDVKGNKIVNQDGLIPFQDKTTKKYGYKDMNGKTIIEPQYESANEFENGAAIVEVPNTNKGEMTRRIGLIDMKGSYLIKPEYTGIHSIGEGLYAVNKRAFLFHDRYVPNAIFNKQGEKLSDFLYFNVQNFKGEYASACDDTTTFFINKNGSIVSTMPRVKGIGKVKYTEDVISADADSVKSYYKKNGDLIWMQDNSILLEDGIEIKRMVYRPSYSIYIEYPEFRNLPDQSVQDKINKKLKSVFVLDSEASEKSRNSKDAGKEAIQYPFDLDKSFSVIKNGNLIIIGETGYLYTGGAHGMPSQGYFHINYKTGDFYELADLFKKGSNFSTKLTAIIQQQVSTKAQMKLENPDYYFEPGKIAVREKQPFELKGDYLRIYYSPYEIAPYAAGFPEFKIPYGQIVSVIDTESPLWKSFNKEIKDSITMYIGSVNADAAKSINELMNAYEKNMVEAINSNDFSKVEGNLVAGSSLYNDQKKLVDSLNKQGIKEKLNSVDIYAIAYEYSKKEYKVFVNEEIAIQYTGAEFTNKKFSWCYTVKEENGKYKLSGIDNW